MQTNHFHVTLKDDSRLDNLNFGLRHDYLSPIIRVYKMHKYPYGNLKLNYLFRSLLLIFV